MNEKKDNFLVYLRTDDVCSGDKEHNPMEQSGHISGSMPIIHFHFDLIYFTDFTISNSNNYATNFIRLFSTVY